MKVRSPRKRMIVLESDKLEFQTTVDKSLHLTSSLNRPTKQEIELANELSNKVLGFATTLPNRNIKFVELMAFVDTRIDRNVIPTFMEISSIADFNSKLKMNVKPLGIVFSLRKNGMEVMMAFTHSRKYHGLNLMLNKKMKEAPWDIILTTYESINSVVSAVVDALGVKLEHG